MYPGNRRRVNLPKQVKKKSFVKKTNPPWRVRGKMPKNKPIPKAAIEKAIKNSSSSIFGGIQGSGLSGSIDGVNLKRIEQLKISRKPIPSRPRNQPSKYNDLRDSSLRIKLIRGIKKPAFRREIAKLMINSEYRPDARIGFEYSGIYGAKPVLSTRFFMTCQTTPEAMNFLKTMVMSKNWATLPTFEKRKQINALETFMYSLGKREFSEMISDKTKRDTLLKSINEITSRGYKQDKISLLMGTFNANESSRELTEIERRANLARTNSILRHTKRISIREIQERQKLLRNLENIFGYEEETKKRLEYLEKKGRLNPRQAILLQEIQEGKRVTLSKLKDMTQILMSNKLIDNVSLKKLVSTKEGIFTAYNLVNNNQGKIIYSIFMKNGYAKRLFNSLISTPEGVKKLNRALSQQGKRVFYANLMSVADADGRVWNVIDYFIRNDVVELNKLPKEVGDKLKDAIKIMKSSARNKKSK